MKFRMQVGVMDCLSCGNCVDGEVRFASVMKQFPTEAAGLFQACEDMAKKRYQSYVRMTKMDWSNE